MFYREEKSIQFTDVLSNTENRNDSSRPRVWLDLAAVNRTPQCMSDGGSFSMKGLGRICGLFAVVWNLGCVPFFPHPPEVFPSPS